MKDIYNIYVSSAVEDGGIYHYQSDINGNLSFIGKTEAKKTVYSVIYKGKIYSLLRDICNGNSGLISYDLNSDGTIGKASEIIDTKGIVGCHLLVNDSCVYVANYLSGSVFKTPDTLICHRGNSINSQRQEAPHPHFVCQTPDNQYICAVDLGTDTIYVYAQSMEKINEVKVTAGYGPRHMVFSEDGKYAFVVCELSSTVEMFSYMNGEFEHLYSYSCLPENHNTESTAAAIRRFSNKIYVSNRGHDSITAFKIVKDRLEKTGNYPCGGTSPRDINIADGNLLFSANELSNTVTAFKINGSGDLCKLETELKIPCPQCITVKETDYERNFGISL